MCGYNYVWVLAGFVPKMIRFVIIYSSSCQSVTAQQISLSTFSQTNEEAVMWLFRLPNCSENGHKVPLHTLHNESVTFYLITP